MTRFHAVMLDETGCEFGVDLECATREDAYAALRNAYEESRCVQLESPEDAAEREERIYRAACRDIDGPDYYEDEDEDWDQAAEDEVAVYEMMEDERFPAGIFG